MTFSTVALVARDRRAQLIVVLFAGFLAVAAIWLVPARAAITGVQSGGALQLTQTGARSALINITAMAPGEEVSGDVTLGNNGILPGGLRLTLGDLAEEDGAGGRPLSEVLVVTLSEGDRVLYRGGLDALGTIDLGRLTPIAKRTFRIAVAWPDGGAPASATQGDNAYQGGRTTFSLLWGFAEDAPPAGAVAASSGSGITASSSSSSSRSGWKAKCISRRKFTIRVASSKSRRPKSAVIYVGKKRVKVLRGKRLTAVVDLRGLKAQTISVKIKGRTVKGRPYTETRRYQTCVAKKTATQKTTKRS